MGYSILNPYTPCGRFRKIVLQGECEFSNEPTFCVIFEFDLSQREEVLLLEVPKELLYFEFTLPLYYMFLKSRVVNSNGVP